MGAVTALAQDAPCGPSDPSVPPECGNYQWPMVQSPCPEVQIKQKHDHTPLKQYRSQGWDTVVDCIHHTLELSCMPYIPVQYFNGQYTVDTIPFDPPDPTFALGVKMPVSTDDDFAADTTRIPFPFYFFGIQKNYFVLGANGMISFNTATRNKYCPWQFSHALPWPDNTSGAPQGMGTTVADMRDAIYGVYEDTHPIAAYLHGDQGIYYGIQGEEPCRKIICSWNGIPTYPGTRNQNNRCTYQIVCYEGSNIIEVHVKRRAMNSNWQNGRGLIGIQNATGLPQQKGNPMQGDVTNVHVVPNSPAAFYPAGGNLLTTTLDSFAVRFTPQGLIAPFVRWYRVFNDGRPSVELTTEVTDTNGYYVRMQRDLDPTMQTMPLCPTLTTAYVSPTEESRYVFLMRYSDAAGTVHTLTDTIVIGVDRAKSITLRPAAGHPGDTVQDLCAGERASLMIEYPPLQDTLHTEFQLSRIHNGVRTPLPDSLLVLGQLYEDEVSGLKRIPVVLMPDEGATEVPVDDIDSIEIFLSVDFVSTCHNTTRLLVRHKPVYDTTEHHGICLGDVFHWEVDGNNYTQPTTSVQYQLQSVEGCDSIVHLDLKVYDVSYTVDEIFDCRPVTWINGQTYTESNTATAATDTIHLLNEAGCDSIVQLALVIEPMTAAIHSSLEYFDYDHMEVELTDISTGGAGRQWLIPNSDPKTDLTVYYSIPANLDSVNIGMAETSPFGCRDTAWVMLPFRKEVIWMPNIFTPGNPGTERNGLFASHSQHLKYEEMYIYNRRGELVYRCQAVDCPWDGRDMQGRECPQGSYVYLIRYITEYEPHVTHTLKGTVTLIR